LLKIKVCDSTNVPLFCSSNENTAKGTKMISGVKMNSNGNDFIVLDNSDRRWNSSEMSKMALALCRRRESVGADGLLAVESSEKCHFMMRLFNRDGSEGEMCGNGARCIARYAYEKGIAPQQMTFETLAGHISATVTPPSVKLSMNEVNLSEMILDCPVEFEGFHTRYSFLTAGVPHAVLFIGDLHEKSLATLASWGKTLRYRTDLFPQGANINFVCLKEKALYTITYERGVEDITRSCGTGAVASAIVAYRTGKCDSEVEVDSLGGRNHVSLVLGEKGRRVFPFLAGSTVFVARMEILEESLA
jgi:diaminopimelate epimerase